jgi:hypothetical protein
MDAVSKTAKLEEYRAIIDRGEELTAQQFVLYQGLEAWEARASAGNITPPHAYLHIHLLFNGTNTMASIIYIYSDSSSPCHRRSRYVVLFV